jgi:hypothetical protein
MTRPENKNFTLNRAEPRVHSHILICPLYFASYVLVLFCFFLLYFAHPIRPFQLSAATNVFTPWPGELLKVPSAKEYRLFFKNIKKKTFLVESRRCQGNLCVRNFRARYMSYSVYIHI